MHFYARRRRAPCISRVEMHHGERKRRRECQMVRDGRETDALAEIGEKEKRKKEEVVAKALFVRP